MTPAQARYILVGIVLTVLLVGAVFLLRLTRPALVVPESNFPRAQGPLNAPVQIIEYSDFQCPACQKAQTDLFQLMGQYAGKIRLIYQHFPLDGHRWSPLAHHCAECAARQDRFWVFHDRLYAEQSIWSNSKEEPLETFLKYAKEGGLDLDQFARCLVDQTVDRRIDQEKKAGLGLGVKSTPSFFVNGKMVIGGQNLRVEVEKQIPK